MLGEQPHQVSLLGIASLERVINPQAVLDKLIVEASAVDEESPEPPENVNAREGYDHGDDPEPEESVDSLVEQIERENTLHSVQVICAELYGFYVADGDAWENARVRLSAQIGLARQNRLQNLVAVKRILPIAQKHIHEINLEQGHYEIQQFDHDIWHS